MKTAFKLLSSMARSERRINGRNSSVNYMMRLGYSREAALEYLYPSKKLDNAAYKAAQHQPSLVDKDTRTLKVFSSSMPLFSY